PGGAEPCELQQRERHRRSLRDRGPALLHGLCAAWARRWSVGTVGEPMAKRIWLLSRSMSAFSTMSALSLDASGRAMSARLVRKQTSVVSRAARAKSHRISIE